MPIKIAGLKSPAVRFPRPLFVNRPTPPPVVSPRYLLSFKRAIAVTEQDGDVLLVDKTGPGLRLASPSPAVRRLLASLQDGNRTAQALMAATQDAADAGQLAEMLENMQTSGMLASTLVSDARPIATLEPLSPSFRFAQVAPEGRFRLSRFACLRRDDDGMVLETPLTPARLLLHDNRLAALLGLLANPCPADDLADESAGFDQAVARAVLVLLAGIGAALPCDADGRTEEDLRPALRVWEFHDLLYHSRSRLGRNTRTPGATMRFQGDLAPLPAVKPPMSSRTIALHKPDLAVLSESDIPFSRVAESRASRRDPGAQALDMERLGDFLYRVARIKTVLPVLPQGERPYESALKPVPSGGGIHSLELYIVVRRVDGLAPGFYRYDSATHGLEHLTEPTSASRRLLADAVTGAALPEPPDALFVLASRFGRSAWKYESIAYALVLKEAGALMQQMYLVATALGLSPCALGAGNPDAFARASGLNYFEECSVGEFMLSGPPDRR